MPKILLLLIFLVSFSVSYSQDNTYDYYSVSEMYDEENDQWRSVVGIAKFGYETIDIEFDNGITFNMLVDLNNRVNEEVDSQTHSHFDARFEFSFLDGSYFGTLLVIYDAEDTPIAVNAHIGSEENEVTFSVRIRPL